MYSVSEMRTQRARIAHEMTELSQRGLSTSEQRERFERLDKEQRELKDKIQLAERRVIAESPIGAGYEMPEAERRYSTVYDRYLRFGAGKLNSDDHSVLFERRATVGVEGTPTGGAYPSSTSGFFVPVGFSNEVETATKFYGDMLQAGFCRIVDTATGAPLPWPTSNDTGTQAEIVGEGQQVSTNDVNIGQIVFGSYKYSSKMVKVSLEILQDSAFNLNAFLTEQFGQRFGRKLNSDFLTGSGTNMPTGVMTAMTNNGAPTYTAIGASTNDGVSGANTIGADDIVNVIHALDPSYRVGASFLMNDGTFGQLQRLKDKYGRPLWNPGLTVGAPDNLYGHRYYLNPYMASLQTQASSPAVTNTTLLFGRFDKYLIRRVKEMSILRLEERFADYGQIAFIGFARYDANLLDAGTHPIVSLVNTY